MQDDPAQCLRVDSVMASLSVEEPGYVSLPAVLELVWVLSSIYRKEKIQIILALEQLISQRQIAVEQTAAVRRAIEMYRRSRVGFADCLIAACAISAGCARTLTFDKDAAKTAGMTLIP
jgi:predicted nucleic-acid-binding protein